ncbi:MAG: hypothetical protein FWG83_05330 [Oscillospiraceae bacterium]|nr:hypothetical protein [Oscillospiraceae bacterium]
MTSPEAQKKFQDLQLENIQKTELEEEQIPLSVQLNQSYVPQKITQEREGEIVNWAVKTNQQITAENIKLGLLEQTPIQITEPNVPAPEFDAYVGMSARKRKKLEDRRNDGMAKARKNGFKSPTKDTLPISDEAKKYHKEKNKLLGRLSKYPVEDLTTIPINADMFSPVPYKEGCDTTLDVRGILLKIDQIKYAVNRYKEESQTREIDIDVKVKYAVLERIGNEMERTMELVMKSNGNEFSGEPCDGNEEANAYLDKDGAIKQFKELMKNRYQLELDEFAKLIEPEINQLKENIDAEYIEQQKDTSEKYRPFFRGQLNTHEEGYMKFVKALNNNPGKYAEHKVIIDSLYKEFIDLEDKFQREGFLFRALTTSLSEEISDSVYTTNLDERMRAEANTNELNQRIHAVQGALIHLLTGKKIDDRGHILLEQEYNYVTETRAARKVGVELLAEHTGSVKGMMESRNKTNFAENPKDITPFASEYTKQIALGALDFKIGRKLTSNYVNSLSEEFQEQAHVRGIEEKRDPRLANALLNEVHVNEQGAFVTKQDEENYIENISMLDIFFSLDRNEEMEVMLSNFVDEVLAVEITEEMLEPAYIAEHYEELHRLSERILMLDNVKNDYPKLFTDKPEVTDKIKNLAKLHAYFANSITGFARANGVIPDSLNDDVFFNATPDYLNQRKKALKNDMALYNGLVIKCKIELSEPSAKEEIVKKREIIKRWESEKEKIYSAATPKEISPFATANTPVVAMAVADMQISKEIMTLYIEKVAKQFYFGGNVDKRIAIGFVEPFKVDWKGEPLTEHDKAIFDKNVRLIDGLFSGVKEEENAVLREIFDELEEFERTLYDDKRIEDLQDENYLLKNFEKMLELTYKLKFLEPNIRNVNPRLYDANKNRFETVRAIYPGFTMIVSGLAMANGVETEALQLDDHGVLAQQKAAVDNAGIQIATGKEMISKGMEELKNQSRLTEGW